MGGAGGSGMLKFKGKQYPMSIGGVRLGATIGASKAALIGEVYDIETPSDIEGTCTAGQAGVAVVGGGKVAELKNSKGVQLKVKGAQVGLELALDLSGMEVSLKKCASVRPLRADILAPRRAHEEISETGCPVPESRAALGFREAFFDRWLACHAQGLVRP